MPDGQSAALVTAGAAVPFTPLISAVTLDFGSHLASRNIVINVEVYNNLEKCDC